MPTALEIAISEYTKQAGVNRTLPTYSGDVSQEAVQASKQATNAQGQLSKDLVTIGQQTDVAYAGIEQGIQMGADAAAKKIEAEQNRSQMVADGFQQAAIDYGVNRDDAESMVSRNVADLHTIDTKLQQTDSQLISLASAILQDDPFGAIANSLLRPDLVRQHNQLAEIGNSKQTQIDVGLATAQAAGNAASLRIPTITNDMEAAALDALQADTNIKIATNSINRLNTDADFRKQSVAAIVQRASGVMQLDAEKRGEAKARINSQQEAIRFAASEDERRSIARIRLAELKDKKVSEDDSLALFNAGMTTMGYAQLNSIAEVERVRTGNPKLYDQIMTNALTSRLGATPADSYANLVALGVSVGPKATQATQATLGLVKDAYETAKVGAQQSQPYLMAKDDKSKAAIVSQAANAELARRFQRADSDPMLSVQSPNNFFKQYTAEPSIPQKFPISSEAKKALDPLIKSNQPVSNSAVVDTIVQSGLQAGRPIDAVTRDIVNYYAAGASMRNRGLEVDRFAFGNVPEVISAMKSYPITFKRGWGDSQTYDVTKPTDVKHMIVRRIREQAIENTPFGSTPFGTN